MEAERVHQIDGVSVWIDENGGITIKALTPAGDPVELSSTQARRLAALLNELADLDDA
jgi:hypothetical protein